MRGNLFARIDPGAERPILHRNVRDKIPGEGER
jgi:hypothetical protein